MHAIKSIDLHLELKLFFSSSYSGLNSLNCTTECSWRCCPDCNSCLCLHLQHLLILQVLHCQARNGGALFLYLFLFLTQSLFECEYCLHIFNMQHCKVDLVMFCFSFTLLTTHLPTYILQHDSCSILQHILSKC